MAERLPLAPNRIFEVARAAHVIIAAVGTNTDFRDNLMVILQKMVVQFFAEPPLGAV